MPIKNHIVQHFRHCLPGVDLTETVHILGLYPNILLWQCLLYHL